MADQSCWNAAHKEVRARDREFYELVRDATKVAEVEALAQVQAAMAAAGKQNLEASSHLTSDVRGWTLQFRDARLEAAYHRKSKTNCSSCDYVASFCRLWAAVPPVVMALSGYRLSCGWPLASASSSAVYLCVICNTCIAAICAVLLTLQLRFSGWYQSHRGSILLWFASVLWIMESVQLFVKADDLRVFITQILVPAVYMSFTCKLPYIVHLKSRAFGLGCQVVAILSSANYIFAPWLLLIGLIGHFLGASLLYILDWRSRQSFLQSLPRWLLDGLCESRSQPTFFQSNKTEVSSQMWNVCYPELFESSKDVVNTHTAERTEEPVSRRALGGFAGGFGGVSGLKCRSSSSPTLVSLSSNTLSLQSDSSSRGHLATFLPTSTGYVESSSVLLSDYNVGGKGMGAMAPTTSACSQVRSKSRSKYCVRYRGR